MMFSAARRQVLIDATWWALIPGAVFFLVLQTYVHVQGGMLGVDSHAYWLAAREPSTWYDELPRYRDAYLYSPAFAQLLWVFGKLPWPMFSALWMAVHLGLLGWLMTPLGWRRGLTLGAFFVTEILLGNVYLLFAASLVLMVRGRGAALMVPLLTKVVPTVIGLWYLPRREVRPMVEALVSTIAVVGVSVAIAPGAWIDWLHFLIRASGTEQAPWVSVLRVLAGASLALFASRTGRAWLLAPAMLLAIPILGGFGPFAILAAIPRLLAWTRGAAPSPHAAPEDVRVLTHASRSGMRA